MPEGTPEARLAALGLVLPPAPKPLGTYVPFQRDGNIIYLSGQGPRDAEGKPISGKVPTEVSIDGAYQLARRVGLSLLSVAASAAGGLSRLRALKVLGMVNAVPEFREHPRIINGCSDLFVAVLGDNGQHARSAVGFGSLPNQIPVEIEAIFRVLD
ncbi:MAG: RidA family protein [Alphaproteobacteria bacterium]|nr:RidA family protein [Alphaproteobacteria bacterium]